VLTPALYLFAKAPVPGAAKTRLQPPLDANAAADVAAELLVLSARHAATWWPGEVTLCCTPDTSHPLFGRLAQELHLRVAAQGEGDLGERMDRALRAGVAAHGAAAVIGCDLPHLPGRVLEQAFEMLARGREVIGPACDGGYYLIGLTRPDPSLFAAIPWGSGQVLERTRARAAAAGRSFEELPAWCDIDTWADLVAAGRESDEIQKIVEKWL